MKGITFSYRHSELSLKRVPTVGLGALGGGAAMPIKKPEIYSSLWKSCDELRGGMDASQYKDYILVLLFIKYVSDKYAGQPFAPITIPDGASFKSMVVRAMQM